MRQARRKLLDQRRKDWIEEDVSVLGVIDDVLQLLGEQARVDRMQHPPRGGDAIVELEVTIGVPGERRDPVAGLEPERVERVGQPFRPRRDLGVGRAMDRAVGAARDDLAFAVPAGGIVDERRDQKRTLLHQSKHSSLPAAFGRSQCVALRRAADGGPEQPPADV